MYPFPALACSFDPLGLAPKDDPAAWKELQTKELNNGRLAMIAIAAFTAEELVSKQEIFEHLALRFEKEAILELDDIERDVGIKNVSFAAWVLAGLLLCIRLCQAPGDRVFQAHRQNCYNDTGCLSAS